ncbi:glutathione S-transferase family protein [Pseudorhodoplanes sp.]|uniref:glutathione S-transferase family protein n=1 Tax=Pseudorhodoplanes sp. TaxID=1934341 RepID=UPI002BE796B6|nr:glutathione S-transferase family protein [Pseudorhodoplanes sp.]HWV53316.1 glutathione S-transferase family protein [Pseudorhodoplanes sp.]
MSDEIVLYTNPMSRGRVARWMLEEVGAPYRAEILDYATTMKAPAYLAINPMGKVPAITHNGKVVTENAAICVYLAEAFPDAGLAPKPSERADFYRWMFFAAGPFEYAVTNNAFGMTPPADRAAAIGYGNLKSALDTLEYAVTRMPFIAGARFTAADLYVGSHLGFGMQFGTVEKRPAFQAYYAKIADRPAAKRAAQLDDALMPKQAAGA